MVAYLEHVNMTVPDIDAATAFLRVVEPALTVRHDATPEGSYRWAHVGAGNCYIALQEPHLDSEPADCHRPYKDYGVNHIGWVVDDIDATIDRLKAAGYEEGLPGESSRFRRRAYFYDSAGFEWEIVAYNSEDLSERYSYG
jgi:catechol 2,3-dioxygenase-like lactoylglutathione lyase family enzyme